MRFRTAVLGATAALLGLALASAAGAVPVVFSVSLSGDQEVGTGDPTGSGTGTVSLDPDTDIISWNISYQDLSNPVPTIYPVRLSGWHIHGPDGPAGMNAPVLVDLDQLDSAQPSGVDSIPDGTLMGMVGADSGVIDDILADPTDYYVNLHTSDDFNGAFAGFPAGAIRGQLGEVPEPGVALGVGSLLVAVALARRRRPGEARG